MSKSSDLSHVGIIFKTNGYIAWEGRHNEGTIIFAGGGPALFLTSYKSFSNPGFVVRSSNDIWGTFDVTLG